MDGQLCEPDGQTGHPSPGLAPDIVAAILDETLSPELTLFELAVDPLALWGEQWGRIGTKA